MKGRSLASAEKSFGDQVSVFWEKEGKDGGASMGPEGPDREATGGWLCDILTLAEDWGCREESEHSAPTNPTIFVSLVNHRQGRLRQQAFVSHCSGSWKFKMRVPAWLGSGEDPLPGLQMSPSHCVLTWWRERNHLSRVSSHKGSNFTIRAPLS